MFAFSTGVAWSSERFARYYSLVDCDIALLYIAKGSRDRPGL